MFSRLSRKTHTGSFRELRDYFHTLGDGARLRILDDLAASPRALTVSDLARQVRMSQPLCSWHLRRLVKIGLVKMQRVGRQALCSLDRERMAEYEKKFSMILAERYARAAAASSLESERE